MSLPPVWTKFVEQLCAERKQFSLPRQARTSAEIFANQVMGFLYPHFTASSQCDISDFEAEIDTIEAHLTSITAVINRSYGIERDAIGIVAPFMEFLPHLRELLDEDAQAIDQSDPASSGIDEVILCYPGFLAIAAYRISHFLLREGMPLYPRLIGEYAHRQTGIDIHAGAQIGRRFAIDHGTGIVIGGSAQIGNGVKIYQGVTLGALAVKKSLAGAKRHPTLEDDVTVYANATILGGSTVVGKGSVVGGNVWLTESVPPFSRITRSTIVRSQDDPLEFYI